MVAARSASLDAVGCRISTISTHQLARPLKGADPDQQQGQAERQAQGQVRGAETEDLVGLVADLEGEVRDAEQQRADRGQSEHRRDLALGASPGPLVDVRGPRLVLVETRVGDGIGELSARRCGAVLVGVDAVRVAGDAFTFVDGHALTPFLERTELEAIQIAKATQAPIPTTQANVPSLTGP